MMEQPSFQPHIPPNQTATELSPVSILTGITLAVVFGAANAYLGLRVGMTVSASIPAAVISMGVIRVILSRDSVLESNLVQTIGSAGESVAAGAIFTLPVFFLWSSEGRMAQPSILEITLLALIGGLLGVLFMIPLRNALIVTEHDNLPYPEGTACAQVLLAGERTGGASTVFIGMALSALVKILLDGLKLFPGEISFQIPGYAGEIGTQIYPAVFSVGFICGGQVASYLFAGGVLSWSVLIPVIVFFGGAQIIPPAQTSIGELFSSGGASAVWNTYIRYIGAGALSAGGIFSLIKTLPLILLALANAIKNIRQTSPPPSLRTQQDLSRKTIVVSLLLLIILFYLIPSIPSSFPGILAIVTAGFFFATVSSRMVGLVGSSNNPVSGMAIATLLAASVLLKNTESSGISAMRSAIAIGSVICIIASVSGDTSQDLKTGFLLGATPKKQQLGEIIGVTASALAIGGTLYLLDRAWGFGSEELAAPQATLMKLIVEGVMENTLPWPLIFMGVFLCVTAQLLRIPILPFAIGLYLPVQLSACIMLGGLVRILFEHFRLDDNEKTRLINNGILFCSGMIAGEGLAGIFLAILTLTGTELLFAPSLSPVGSTLGSVFVLSLLLGSLFYFSFQNIRKK